MRRYYYDLHIHSCLSPCGSDEATPSSIAGMAKLGGLDIAALTDHNTAKNCPAFFEAAREYGIVPVAGMEFTTSEDIHAVCLFEDLDSALRFDAFVDTVRTRFKNKPEIFGEQLIMDSDDNVIGKDEYLLPVATSVSIEDLPSLVAEYGGICYPAHIDRESGGIIAILGTFPDGAPFTCYELRSMDSYASLSVKHPLGDRVIVVSSDSHLLTDISEGDNYFELKECDSEEELRKELFRHLRRL